MSKGKIVRIIFLIIIGLIALDFGTGYLGVIKTRTVGKAKQNAQREVFEETQSYVEGKRQEAAKDYKEWLLVKDPGTKQALENLARHKFANVNVDIFEGPVKTWVYNCKNSVSQTPITVPQKTSKSPFN